MRENLQYHLRVSSSAEATKMLDLLNQDVRMVKNVENLLAQTKYQAWQMCKTKKIINIDTK